MRIHSALRASTALWLSLAVHAPLRAQCGLAWLPGARLHGTDDAVWAAHSWDPDGAGPAPTRLVLGGTFLKAGTVPATKIVTWNPATGEWEALGGGYGGYVYALATAANGDLLVGGNTGIVRWNGTSWTGFGQGPSVPVRDIAVMPNGDVVVVGSLWNGNVSRWNGTTWSSLAFSASNVFTAVLALPNGDLVVGGDFTSIGGVAANHIARWDGVAWHPLGAGVDGSISQGSTISVYELVRLPNGTLVAGGNFTSAGGLAAPGVAAWNGNSWSGLGTGLGAVVSSLRVTQSGTLLANAPVSVGAPGISEWDGVAWHPATQGFVSGALEQLPNGEIVAGGLFSMPTTGGQEIRNVARWDGAAWQPLDPPSTPWLTSAPDSVRDIAVTPDGTLYATGWFQIVDGVPLHGIARFNGSTWSQVGGPLGIGSLPNPYPLTAAMIATQNGDIVVGGRITSIAGGPAAHVVRWNGTAWDNMGGGVGAAGSVTALAEMPDGNIVVGGDFTVGAGGPANRVARWDGAAWSALGTGVGGAVSSLLAMPNGDVIVGGNFTTAGGIPANGVARWNGSSWSPLGAGHSQGPAKLRMLPTGDVVALVPSAPWSVSWTVQRWDGITWTQLGAPFATASLTDLVVLPDGELLVSGPSYLGVVQRWDGATWSPMPATDAPFHAHAWLPDGDLVVAGLFGTAGPWLSPNVARLHSGCTASALVTGAGCAGSGGNNVLRAASLPWLGSRVRTTGTGLPTLALVSQVWGLSAMQLPLAALLPQALPGCDLLVTPDYVEFAVTTDGTVESSVALPNNPALAGVQLHHQLNLFEIDPSLNVLAITASNALLLTTGAF